MFSSRSTGVVMQLVYRNCKRNCSLLPTSLPSLYFWKLLMWTVTLTCRHCQTVSCLSLTYVWYDGGGATTTTCSAPVAVAGGAVCDR